MTGKRHAILLLAAWSLLALAGCAQFPVSFPSDDAEGGAMPLRGTLWRPQGDGPFPALVLLPGCGGLYARGGELRPHARDWGWRLRDQGYVVLLVDSFSPRGKWQGCVPGDRAIRPGVERVNDAYGALRYLRERPDVMPQRIGLLGWSHGGVAALAAVGAGAPGAARTAPAEGFRMAAAFYPACLPALRGEWQPSVPVLLLLAGSDQLTPPGPCLELAGRARALGQPVQVALYEGAAHGFDTPPGYGRRFGRGPGFAGRWGLIAPHPRAREAAIDQIAAYAALHLKD